MQKNKQTNHAGAAGEKEGAPPPFPETARLTFADVPTIREPGAGYRHCIFSETPPEKNIFVNVISRTHVDRRKRIFFENDDVLVSDLAPDKKSLLPP